MPRPHTHQNGLQARRNAANVASNDTDISTLQTDVTAAETRLDDIETKTDFISVSQATDLDDVQLASETPVNLGTRLAALEYNYDILTKTANYTALITDGIILVDTNAGAVTITLPTAVGNEEKQYTIKLIEATSTCTIDGDGTETIDGATTKVISTLYDTVKIVSDNVEWWII